ncbi:MAG: DNA gyrase subunit A [Legionellales bacterium]|nr:DNA gyrase subunit A [Legionellales bacterium]
MSEVAKEVLPVNIEDELKQSYMDYAMSVIVGRALPDVRDGLKPVHRRVLYSMHEIGNDWNKGYKKSARIVGDVIGKYHPHGDVAVYDTIVRLAQPFSMRYMLVDGQGNFGSIDGDSAAAMRYTEIRLAKISHSIMADLDKETVDFVPNYDESEFMPAVMPTRIPNLLVNGASGIAVGMATNIPTHNLGEVIDATIALIADPDLTIDDLMQHIPGPDFPTAGIISGRAGIMDAYRTGRGRVYVRARTEIEEDKNSSKQAIIVNELPYQVNKARLIEKIAELVKDKKLEGISGLRDESDKDGIRIVIELKRGEMPEVVLNNLYTYTQLQSVTGINMVALNDGRPQLMNLKQILQAFVRHRRVVVNRRTVYELKKARDRAHVLEGLGIALVNIDPVIQKIKESANPAEARERLQATLWAPGVVAQMLSRSGAEISRPEGLSKDIGMQGQGYRLSETQAQAILDLKLHRLTALEKDKILEEYEAIIQKIKDLIDILENPERLMRVITDELVEIKSEFSDERRTEITAAAHDLSREDLISEEDRVVTLSKEGYVKAQPVDAYQAQRRGGRGKSATSMKDEDLIDQILVASTHDTILCFSSAGKVYWLKVYQLPLGSRTSRGRPIVNLLPLEEGENISAILPLRLGVTDGKFVIMATTKGTVKKVSLTDFSRPRSSGIIAIDLDSDDSLVGASLTEGQSDILLFSNAGKVARFNENTVRCMGRNARGVRGIRMGDTQHVISLIVRPETDDVSILTATENGFGKRTLLSEFPVKGRGGQGVIAIQTTDRNGSVVGAVSVEAADDVILITDMGTLVRIPAQDISLVGRNTQGVRLINLCEKERLVGLQRISELQEDETTESVEDTEESS